jgi:hypothetical protein
MRLLEKKMPKFLSRPKAESYGHAVGILLIEAVTPYIPGDVANASTYGYPVVFKTVPGVTIDRLINDFDPSLTQAVVDTAKYFEDIGVRFITGDCGFLMNFQEQVARAVSVPVALSSLLQLPIMERSCGPDRKIGIISANRSKLGEGLLRRAGLSDPAKAVVVGLEDFDAFASPILRETPLLDSDLIKAEVVERAKAMVEKNPEIGPILLECSCLPPYAHAVQAATNRPVFDFITMIDYMTATSFRKPFCGFY